MKNMPLVVKQFVSEFIDLMICTIPAIILYLFSTSDFGGLNIGHITALIYLGYTFLSTFLSDGQSIGDIFQKIVLINTKKDHVKSKTFFLIRSVIKSSFIFLIADFDQTSIITTILLIVILFPIKIITKEYTYYSFLNFGFKLIYINKEDLK